jgi:hypothetical protein
MKRLVIVIGLLVFLAGIVAIVHPTFSYHKKEEVAKIGSIHATVDEEKTAEIPMGATVALLVAGLVLVVLGSRMKQ